MALHPPSIAFIDLAAQRRRLGARIDAAVARVLEHCQFIMGPEVYELERRLASFCGARHAISCASGTDALAMVLMAQGVKPGDAVFCPSFTFCATAEVVVWLGATPVFVDVDEESFNLCPNSLRKAIATARSLKLRPVAVIPVDLFGLPAPHAEIAAIAREHGLWILDDAAQAFGATLDGRRLGSFGLATATSFFPAKPLGCYGDGGAIFTDDEALAEKLRSIRVHGQGVDKYDTARIGMTGRLDTIQAAILLEKLAVFEEEIAARNRVADLYASELASVCQVPRVPEGSTSVWAQYTLKVPPEKRDALADHLKAQSIPYAIYYPKPLHMQTPYAAFPRVEGGLAVTDRLARSVISLPMHPDLDERTQRRIIEGVTLFFKK